MSFHRANIIWKSPDDNMWRLGFYTTHESSSWDDEDYDSEWDVDYDYESFEWTSPACRAEGDVWRHWNGPNPGSTNYAVDDAEARNLDVMWKMHRDPEFAAKEHAKRHKKFIDNAQAVIYASGDLDDLRAGTEVTVYRTDKLNIATAPMGRTGRLTTAGEWLVLGEGPEAYKVYNQATGRLYRYGKVAVTMLKVHRPHHTSYGYFR